jgi:hypothetical protein
MGQYPLLNKETGVYSYDQLVVLRSIRMPAVLLEAGSIISRDEELKMDSPERQDIISGGVTAAVKESCDPGHPRSDLTARQRPLPPLSSRRWFCQRDQAAVGNSIRVGSVAQY